MGKESVFVLDDEGRNRRLIRRYLEQGGYSVMDFADYGSASRAVEDPEVKFDYALLDFHLGDVDNPGRRTGADIADLMRKTRSDIKKIIVMSGTVTQADVPGYPLLQKAFTSVELLKLLRQQD